MCYVYGDKDTSSTPPDIRPTQGIKDSNGGSTLHPRTDTLRVCPAVGEQCAPQNARCCRCQSINKLPGLAGAHELRLRSAPPFDPVTKVSLGENGVG
jgi:hypothetical protein